MIPARLPPLLTVFLALLLAPAVHAQTIRGQLVERETGAGIDGALVVLLDERDGQRAGSLTDEAGRFTLQAPGPGAFRVRAERIGYGNTVSAPFSLGADQVLEYRLEAAPSAVRLEGIQVQARRRCLVRPEDGILVTTLWEEARKALNAAAWSQRQELVRYRAIRYERELERGLRVASERTETWWGGDRSPFVSLPAEELIREGYVRPDGDTLVYFAPDLDVLLSDVFLDSYCIGVVQEREGLIGVSFEPAGRRSTPDVSGVFWIDPATAELRLLEYRYVRLPSAMRSARAGGEVEFQRLPSGAWLVRRWAIRMPQLAERTARVGTADLRERYVTGFREEGGEVVEIQGAGGERLAASRRAVLEGVVYDSLANAPLGGATVYLDGTSYSATTDEGGAFRLDDLPTGAYRVAFLHPLLDSLELMPRPREVRLDPAAPARIELAVPSRAGLLAARCSGEVGAGTAVIVGFLTQADTEAPLAATQVVASWSDGRLTVRTDKDGGYRFCAAPRGVDLTLEPRLPARTHAVEASTLRLGGETVVRHDFVAQPVQRLAAGRPADGDAVQLRGRLLDAETGRPIADARVRLEGQGVGQTTDRNGRFTLADLQPRVYTLEVEHLAYGKQAQAIAIEGGGVLEVEIQLGQQAIELAGVTVAVRSAREELRRRSGTSLGLLDREDLARHEATAHHVGDVLRLLPGLRVREMVNDAGMRSYLCIESTRNLPIETAPPPCRPVAVYFDDMRMPDGPEFLLSVPLHTLESVQYIPAIVARSRYGIDGEYGVLLLYTRGGGPTGRRAP